MTSRVTSHQFGLFRALLGAYLIIHFLHLLPHGVELFSAEGMIPDPTALPTWGVLPNLFWLSDSPTMVLSVLWAGVGLGALLMLGVSRQVVCLLLWLIWMSLYNRNILISNPSLPYVGLILLLMTAIPSGEALSLSKKRPDWALSKVVYWGFCVLLMGGYTISGIHKMGSPSWIDGSAISHVLNLPLGRDNAIREFVLGLPPAALQLKTWGSLGLEVLALPLFLIPATRKWIWLGLVLMQLGILSMVRFADLTSAMLLAHLFVFDRHWIAPTEAPSERSIVFFDGVCGLCNRAVDFILAEDQDKRFSFAPVQGETASQLEDNAVKSGQSMALQVGETLYTKSDAVLKIAAGLGGLWRVFSWLQIVPRPIRNGVYFLVQKTRYQVFGKRDTCRLPSAEEQDRFLP